MRGLMLRLVLRLVGVDSDENGGGGGLPIEGRRFVHHLGRHLREVGCGVVYAEDGCCGSGGICLGGDGYLLSDGGSGGGSSDSLLAIRRRCGFHLEPDPRFELLDQVHVPRVGGAVAPLEHVGLASHFHAGLFCGERVPEPFDGQFEHVDFDLPRGSERRCFLCPSLLGDRPAATR